LGDAIGTKLGITTRYHQIGIGVHFAHLVDGLSAFFVGCVGNGAGVYNANVWAFVGMGLAKSHLG
jgi:hypothetical protein